MIINQRIGLLISARNLVMETDFNNFKPTDVAVHCTRIKKDEDSTNLTTMSGLQQEAHVAAAILANTGVNIAIFGCTAASFLNGEGQDLALAESLSKAAMTPVATTATAVTAALKELQIKRLSILTPYITELNNREHDFFINNGFTITTIKGMGIEQTSRLPYLSPDEIYDFAIKNFAPDSDALFFSCTNIYAMEVIPFLEMALKKPVITSNQASLWYALRKSGNKENCRCGELLRNH